MARHVALFAVTGTCPVQDQAGQGSSRDIAIAATTQQDALRHWLQFWYPTDQLDDAVEQAAACQLQITELVPADNLLGFKDGDIVPWADGSTVELEDVFGLLA